MAFCGPYSMWVPPGRPLLPVSIVALCQCLARPLTLQERGRILQTSCPALGGGSTELVAGSTAPRGHWVRVTAINPQGHPSKRGLPLLES